VTISVRKVASDEELALLRERFRAPQAPPPPRDLESTRAEVIARLEQPLKEVWPNELAPLVSYEIGFSPEDIVVHVRCKSEAPLDGPAEAMLTKVLQTRLNLPKLRLVLEYEAPPKPKGRRASRK